MNRCYRTLLGAAMTAAVVLASIDVGNAQEARYQLMYERGTGAEECAGPDSLREAVVRRLGRDPFVATTDKIIIVRVSRVSDGFAGTVQVLDHGHQSSDDRQLRVRGGCSELLSAIALSVSIVVDPRIALQAPSPSASASSSEAPSASTAVPESSAPPPLAPSAPTIRSGPAPVAAPPPRRFEMVVGAGPMVSWGDAPNMVGGLMVYADGRYDWLRGGFELRTTASATKPLVVGSVSSSATFFLVNGCGQYGVVLGCLVGTAGQLRVEGSGYVDASSDKAFVYGGGLRGGLVGRVGKHLEVRAVLDAIAFGSRYRISVWGSEIYQYPPGYVGAGVGLGVVLP